MQNRQALPDPLLTIHYIFNLYQFLVIQKALTVAIFLQRLLPNHTDMESESNEAQLQSMC